MKNMKTKLLAFLFLFLTIISNLFTRRNNVNTDNSVFLECTSFCLDNNGYAVFGSNYDYPEDNTDGLIFVNRRNISKSFSESDSLSNHVCWISKYGSVSFNLVMSQAAFAGMNEAGLVISVMGLRDSKYPEPDKRPWIHTYLLLQYILDNFSSVEEILTIGSSMRIYGRTPPYFIPHYLVSDKYGNCAVIEFLNGKMIAHTGLYLPVKVLTNTIYDNSISEWRKFSAQNKNGQPVPEMNPSMRRFILAADMISSYKPLNAQAAVNIAFNILQEISGQKIKGSPTLWSMVFDTKNLRIHFKTIVNSEIRMIDFQKLDFSCQSSLKMADINEKLSGDIADDLKEYSSSMHYEHALTAANKWKMEITPLELMKQIRSIEGFACIEDGLSDDKSDNNNHTTKQRE
jgi:penicillin V acylase-like amidase (Ntn superfamily)